MKKTSILLSGLAALALAGGCASQEKTTDLISTAQGAILYINPNHPHTGLRPVDLVEVSYIPDEVHSNYKPGKSPNIKDFVIYRQEFNPPLEKKKEFDIGSGDSENTGLQAGQYFIRTLSSSKGGYEEVTLTEFPKQKL